VAFGQAAQEVVALVQVTAIETAAVEINHQHVALGGRAGGIQPCGQRAGGAADLDLAHFQAAVDGFQYGAHRTASCFWSWPMRWSSWAQSPAQLICISRDRAWKPRASAPAARE